MWRRALELIPGGVNSPVRAMRAVGLDEPLFVRRASGAYFAEYARIGVDSCPSSSSAARIAATRPSIMSLGATASAPAST